MDLTETACDRVQRETHHLCDIPPKVRNLNHEEITDKIKSKDILQNNCLVISKSAKFTNSRKD